MDRSIILLLPFVARSRDLPVGPAKQFLFDDHVGRFLLVIADGDLEGFGDDVAFVVGGELGLLALADDVERAAELHQQLFILGRVLDDVFADEFIGVVRRVFLVNPQPPGGQRDAQAVLLGVLDLEINVDLLVALRPVLTLGVNGIRLPPALVALLALCAHVAP